MEKDNKLEEVQNTDIVEEKILTDEDLLKEENDEVEMDEDLIFNELDGEELTKDSLEVEDAIEDEQVSSYELEVVSKENREEKDETKLEVLDSFDEEDLVEEIASNGMPVVLEKESKKHINIIGEKEFIEEYECVDYKEIERQLELLKEDELFADDDDEFYDDESNSYEIDSDGYYGDFRKTETEPEEEIMGNIEAEEEFTKGSLNEENFTKADKDDKADLNEEKLRKEEQQNITPKKSIFTKVVEKVKSVVSHPVKTAKKVGDKIMDGFIFVSKNGFLVILGVFTATGYLLRHPIKSVKNVFNAIMHPIETYRNIKNDLDDEDDYDYEEEKTEAKEEVKSTTNTKEENTKSNIYSKDEYIPPIELMELDGEEFVRKNTTSKENESAKILESLSGEEIGRNKSSNKETNENKDFQNQLDQLDGEELSKDSEEVIKEEPLQRENGSKYNLNKNSGYANKPIDASGINVNKGSVNLYEEAINEFENSIKDFEIQPSGKAYVKTR